MPTRRPSPAPAPTRLPDTTPVPAPTQLPSPAPAPTRLPDTAPTTPVRRNDQPPVGVDPSSLRSVPSTIEAPTRVVSDVPPIDVGVDRPPTEPRLQGLVSGVRSERTSSVATPDVVAPSGRETVGAMHRAPRDVVEPAAGVSRPPSPHYTYDAWYTGYYAHPYYRYQHVTSVVYYSNYGGYYVQPWGPQWVPNTRLGWVWVPGYYRFGFWHPGYWVPSNHVAPRSGYVWVNGFWQHNGAYIDGYWRPERRSDGRWRWIEGYYLEDGSYVPGHWRPRGRAPEGYAWEPGFWKGDAYIDGFWRPEFRRGFAWQNAYYDTDGVYRAGFWVPVEDNPGQVWVPGWFDGTEWVRGYWEAADDFDKTIDELDQWQPPEPEPVADSGGPVKAEEEPLGLPAAPPE